ncbi:MAG: sulfatase-like hydrolase/transferase [Blastomonas sp.]
MNTIALPFAAERSDPEMRRFLNWVLVWIILANAGFMLLWLVGAPPRHIEILTIGFVGLIARRMPYPVRALAFVGVMAFAILCFIGGLFNLSFSSLVYSFKFFAEINPSNSIEYIIVACAVAVVLGAALWFLRRDTVFERTSLVVAAAAMVGGLAGADIYMGKGMRGHYKREAPVGAYFESATQKTGFAGRADGQRHLVLIIVESLGVPKDNPEMARLLFTDLKIPAVEARYEMSEGTSLYYNSTTAGEVREMCGRWGDYYDLLDRKDDGCLPAQLAAKGYETRALHSFIGSFFERSTWYPNIGFQQTEFDKTLVKNGALTCGGVFPGACDRFVPQMIASKLKAADKPQFLYWLTVNSHLPVPPGLNLNVDNCARISPELARDFPMICRQFSIFHDIDTALAKEITAADFPEADILIVGDHMPPYFDRHHRTQFDPEHVPWLYLKARDRSSGPADSTGRLVQSGAHAQKG